MSLSNGIFPDKLKIAKIIPIFKAGDKHKFTNYRPVSILPHLSKVFEKAFYNRLNSFVEKNVIFNLNTSMGFVANAQHH